MLKGMNSCNIININNHVINIKKNERWYQQSFGRVKHCWATKELNLNVCLQSNMHELAWIYRSKNLTLRDKKSLIKCAFSSSLKSQLILLFSLFFLLGLLHFLILFMGLTILFQLIFTFTYSTFSKISRSQTDPKTKIKTYYFSLILV